VEFILSDSPSEFLPLLAADCGMFNGTLTMRARIFISTVLRPDVLYVTVAASAANEAVEIRRSHFGNFSFPQYVMIDSRFTPIKLRPA